MTQSLKTVSFSRVMQSFSSKKLEKPYTKCAMSDIQRHLVTKISKPYESAYRCSFEITDVFTEYRRNGVLHHSIILDEKHFYSDDPLLKSAGLLIECAWSVGEDTIETLMYTLLLKLIVDEEVENFFDNTDHKPGFIEKWAPEYFKRWTSAETDRRHNVVMEVQES